MTMLVPILSLLALADTPRFEKITITRDFISEGVAIADVNLDGKWDIFAGAYWFEGPDWTPHEIDTPLKRDPLKEYSNSFLDFATDVDHDGYPDLIRVGLPGEELVWYLNPGKKTLDHWEKHELLDHFGNESPMVVDINGDSAPDIVGNDPIAKEVIWFEAPVKKGDKQFIRHVIARGDMGTHRYTHGLGHIDMNGDGLLDVVIAKGWWECPKDARKEDWTFHAEELFDDCAQILTPSKVGETPSILFASSAHDYGVWELHKNIMTIEGSLKRETLYNEVSETHALALADLNGDGRADLISGKRWYAHNGGDRGGKDAAVLFWLEAPASSSSTWTPHIIDGDSGVGLQVLARDMNGDGKLDILLCNKKGLFLFKQN